jgi:hypothetical protein
MIRVGDVTEDFGGFLGQLFDKVVGELHLPLLHWIALDGYDPARQLIFFTDTDGQHYQMSYGDFQAAWNFTVGDSAAAALLAHHGVRPRSIVY